MQQLSQKLDVFSGIRFNPEYHSYTFDGHRTVSVTRVTGSVNPPFDEIARSEASAEKMRAEGKDITAEQLRRQWKLGNVVATAKGTAVPNYIEHAIAQKFLKYPLYDVMYEISDRMSKEEMFKDKFVGTKFVAGVDPDIFDKLYDGQDPVFPKYVKCTALVDKFISDIRGKMIPIKSELVIGSPKYMVCGMVDQLFYNLKSQQFEIWDWKTNTKFDTESKFHLNAPCAHLSQCKLDEYSLQLACYKHMFQEMTGIPIGNCYLCWFSEEQPEYKVFKCKDLPNEAVQLLTQFGGKSNG